jgi:hypothetical protein
MMSKTDIGKQIVKQVGVVILAAMMPGLRPGIGLHRTIEFVLA